jgi:hypothetical protein
MNSVCVDYDGILLENTTLDAEECNTVEDVIEDLVNQVDQNTAELTFGQYESCLEIEPSNVERGLTARDILTAHESEICTLKQQFEDLRNPDEPECESECCDDDEGCCSILKKYDAYSTEYIINQEEWTPSNAVELQYKASKIGTYKFTFELGISMENDPGTSAMVGLSLNGLDPLSNLFEQTTTSFYNANTYIFIKKMLTNDVARFTTKKVSTDFPLEWVKMIVEKVK